MIDVTLRYNYYTLKNELWREEILLSAENINFEMAEEHSWLHVTVDRILSHFSMGNKAHIVLPMQKGLAVE